MGLNLVKIALTLLTVAFLYFHGETLNDQTRTVVHRLAGGRVASLIQIAGDTIRAVWYGMLLTATAQGILAGLGFWAVGLAAPVLLGAATAFLALLPFGPPLLWIPAGLWLLIQGTLWKGVALLTWGALAVSGIDNVLRPLFIGGPLASRICWCFSASWEVWRPLVFWASFWGRRSCRSCWSCGASGHRRLTA